MSALIVSANSNFEHSSFSCHLHISAVFGHHQILQNIRGREQRGGSLPFTHIETYFMYYLPDDVQKGPKRVVDDN
jgi:hypothetical protein